MAEVWTEPSWDGFPSGCSARAWVSERPAEARKTELMGLCTAFSLQSSLTHGGNGAQRGTRIHQIAQANSQQTEPGIRQRLAIFLPLATWN